MGSFIKGSTRDALLLILLGLEISEVMGLPVHETKFWVFRFKLHCLQIFSLKHHNSGVEHGKTTMSSDLQMLKFGSSNLQSSGKPAGSPSFYLQKINSCINIIVAFTQLSCL